VKRKDRVYPGIEGPDLLTLGNVFDERTPDRLPNGVIPRKPNEREFKRRSPSLAV